MNALRGAGVGQAAAAASGSTSDQQQQSPQTSQMGLGASQQQLNLAMQNPVQMMQVIQAQIVNLQRQWATVQAQPESSQKMEAAQHLAVQMKRMKFLQAQTAQALQNRQQQQQQPQQGTQQSQPPQQQQQSLQQQSGGNDAQMSNPQSQPPSTPQQAATPSQTIQHQIDVQSNQPTNGTTLEASNPLHNAQLAALQAFAQQQRMQAMHQQRGSFDGQTWQQGIQQQQQGQSSSMPNGLVAPQSAPQQTSTQSNQALSQQQQQQQSQQTQQFQQQQAQQSAAKGDLTGAVRAFMAARGTPLPTTMATSFIGPSGTTPGETKSVDMQTLFATVVQFGGSARIAAQQNGWAIVASKLGLAVAPIPNNHVPGQNEVDSSGLPLPAFVAPRLSQFFKERFSSFEEFWLAKMKGASGQAAAAAYVATNNGNIQQQQVQQSPQQQPKQQQPQSQPQTQPPLQQQSSDGQQRMPGSVQQAAAAAAAVVGQNGAMQQSAQAGPSNSTPHMTPQPSPQQMPNQAFLSGSASVQEAAQKAHQLQAQLPRQMQQLQELINAGKMTQQQARDKYMYLQNAAKMAMLQAQAQAQAHAASQGASQPQQQQVQGAMAGQQPQFPAPLSQPLMDASGQMRPPVQQQPHQQQQQQQQQQQPQQTATPADTKKGLKRNRKTTGTSKAGSGASSSDPISAPSMQMSPSQSNMQAQQSIRMLQQGNLNQNLQIGAFATIRTAQLASQGITGVDVTAISHTMAQIYSQFLTQAQNAGQPMHIAAPLAFTAAQQEALKQPLPTKPQGQTPGPGPSQQQQDSQRQQSPYPPKTVSQQPSSRPPSRTGAAVAQLQTPVQASIQTPTKPNKFRIEYLPIRRDVQSYGGWDLDVVERQMGEMLDGKGRFPRSVRELGHVDVESLIMSLRSRLEVEMTYSLNALFILTAGVQAPGFHLLLSLCEDLSDELLDILEEAAFGTLYQDEGEGKEDGERRVISINNKTSSPDSPLSYADWVTGIMEEEAETKLWERRQVKRRRASQRITEPDNEEMNSEMFDGWESETEEEEEEKEEDIYTLARKERYTLRCSQMALSILEIFRNLATVDDNHSFLNNEPRFLKLLMKIVQATEEEQRQRRRQREGTSHVYVNGNLQDGSPITVFTSTEALRIRKDVLSIVACLAGETCNMNRLDHATVQAVFDLIASFVRDASDIEQEHGTVYSEVPSSGNLMNAQRTAASTMQPTGRRVPQHADMALEAFSSLAQPDVNRQLLGRIIQEDRLVFFGATLIKLLPVSEIDFQMLKTEARLGFCERIAMSLFNIAYLGNERVKRQLKETVGVVSIIFRCIKRLIRVNTFSKNPFAVITRRLIETLRMLDGGDNFNRPPLLGFGMEDNQGRDNRSGQKTGRGGLLVQDELSVVELMTVEGIDPVMVAELEQLL